MMQPLADRVFRMMWLAWLAGNMTMWMNDVSAAWLMAQLTDDAMWVALVQASATLPLFLLGLPSGALADIVDRKRLYAFAQFWIALVSCALAVLSLAGWLGAGSLLMLCFANGLGLAVRFPVFAAIVPSLVPREQLSAALTLNALAINVSRIGGPLLAGVVMASFGTGALFTLNAALSLVSCWLILAYGPKLPRSTTQPAQGMLATMREGLHFIGESAPMRSVLLRSFVFFVNGIAVLALLPLVAKGLQADAETYMLMLAAMGGGAIVTALALPRLSNSAAPDRVVAICTLLYAAATAGVAVAPSTWLLAPALAATGGLWLCLANTLTMASQRLLPNRLRARGMAIFQMAIMGGCAAGSALWGKVASVTSVQTSLLLCAAAAVIALWLSRGVSVRTVDHIELEAAQAQPVPHAGA